MPNIKFNYFYHDSANYKKFGIVIFANPKQRALSEVDQLLRSKLIDETYFYANEWHLPELFLDTFDFRIDPTWHEFENVEPSTEAATSILSLKEFITIISQTNWIF